MANSIGSVSIDLEARIAKFESDLGRAARVAEKQTKQIERRARHMQENVSRALAAASVVAVGALTVVAKKVNDAVNAMADMDDMAQRVGASAKEFSSLAFAADVVGVSLQDMDQALGRMYRRMSAAAGGGKSQIEMFDKLGISIKDADGHMLSAVDVMKQLADRYVKTGGSNEFLAHSTELLGGSFRKLSPLLSEGRKGIEQMQQEAVRLGLTFDDRTAAAAGHFGDTLAKVRKAVDGMVMTLAQHLLPMLDQWADKLYEIAQRANENWQMSGMKTFVDVTAKLVNNLDAIAVFIGTRFVFKVLAARIAAAAVAAEGLTAAVVGARVVLAALGGPIALAVTGISALAVAVYKYETRETSAQKIQARTRDLVDDMTRAREALTGAMGAAIPVQQKLNRQKQENAKAALLEAQSEVIAYNAIVMRAEADAKRLQGENGGGGYGAIGRAQAGNYIGRDLRAGNANLEAAQQAVAALNDQIAKTQKALEATSGASENAATTLGDVTSASDKATKAQQSLADAVHSFAAGTAVLAENNADARDSLNGMTQAQIDYRRAIRDTVQQYNELIAKGVSGQAAGDMLRERVEAIQEQYALAAQQAGSLADATDRLGQSQADNIGRANQYYETIRRGGESIADNISDTLLGINRTAGSLWSQLVDVAKQAASQIISTFMQLRVIQPVLNGIFSGGTMSVAGSALGSVGQSYGTGGTGGGASVLDYLRGGNSAYKAYQWASTGGLWGGASTAAGAAGLYGGSAALGAASTAGSFVGGSALTGGTYVGGTGLYASSAGTSAAAGGASALASWIPIIGLIIAGVMKGAQWYGEGWDANAPINANLDDSMRWSAADTTVLMTNDALRKLGLSDKLSAIISGQAGIARAWGHKKPHALRGGVDVDFGADGVTGQQYVDWKAKGGWFRSDKYGTETTALADDVRDSLESMWDDIQRTMTQAASALGVSVDRQLTASLKSVTQAGDDGASEYLVTYLGRTWTEATAEAAQQRIGAEGIIRVLEASVGDAASKIAEQWRDSADELMAGAQTILAAQQAIERGTKLLALGDTANTLANVIALANQARAAGEDVAQAYQRIAAANQQYLDFVQQFSDRVAGAGLGVVLAQINRALAQDVDRANALAKAAGLQGAREEDLANIHQAAAQQAADAIRQLSGAAELLAGKLYDVTGNSLQVVQAEIERIMGQVRDSVQLALGDTSIYTDRDKLDMALKGLQAGTVDADQVLRIGQRLYGGASGDYRDLYQQVSQIAGLQSGGDINASLDRLVGLTAQRDKLQSAADAAQRLSDAQTLASYVADIASVRGVDVSDVAQQLGFSLGNLADDLGVSDIEKYLSKLQNEDIPGALGQARSEIVAAIDGIGHDIVQAITGGPLVTAPRPAQDYGTQIRKEPDPVRTAPVGATNDDIVDRLDDIRRELRAGRLNNELHRPGRSPLVMQ